ncbi:hypothetical protein A2Z22_04005 [Candidatus Woesebacteria bacterium RBG_16_34_12]|uniref:Uncharacterized protein n=1 Tax=Candidatus Woesebacteria bacterium RBG_16_34_12 TaxID=1802480 RepID=A0A1F7X7E2_9BACT|nr:MAG: hypothetical protein A2Z22_04005 [Candidatus Woesebacteria bacterium RBG_16_34_12]
MSIEVILSWLDTVNRSFFGGVMMELPEDASITQVRKEFRENPEKFVDILGCHECPLYGEVYKAQKIEPELGRSMKKSGNDPATIPVTCLGHRREFEVVPPCEERFTKGKIVEF